MGNFCLQGWWRNFPLTKLRGVGSAAQGSVMQLRSPHTGAAGLGPRMYTRQTPTPTFHPPPGFGPAGVMGRSVVGRGLLVLQLTAYICFHNFWASVWNS